MKVHLILEVLFRGLFGAWLSVEAEAALLQLILSAKGLEMLSWFSKGRFAPVYNLICFINLYFILNQSPEDVLIPEGFGCQHSGLDLADLIGAAG